MASVHSLALQAAVAAASGPALARTRLVQGTVIDARTGGPVAGARIAIAPADALSLLSDAEPSRQDAAVAGADGRFAIQAEPGAWLLLEHPDFLPEILPAGACPARVLLTAPGAIWGRVRDGRGAPLAGARIHATCPEALDAAEAETDASGVFCLTGLRPGRWIVLAAGGAAPLAPARAAARLSAGRTTCVELRLPRRARRWRS